MKQLNHQQIKDEYRQLPGLLANGPLPIILLLDGLVDPANIGSLFRTADAVRAAGIFFHNVPQEITEPKKLKRYSRHSHESVPHSHITTNQLADYKLTHEIVACEFTDESTAIMRFDWQFPTILVIGSERNGVSPEILALCNRAIHLPMYGQNSSINAAVAGGIVLYQALEEYIK